MIFLVGMKDATSAQTSLVIGRRFPLLDSQSIASGPVPQVIGWSSIPISSWDRYVPYTEKGDKGTRLTDVGPGRWISSQHYLQASPLSSPPPPSPKSGTARSRCITAYNN